MFNKHKKQIEWMTNEISFWAGMFADSSKDREKAEKERNQAIADLSRATKDIGLRYKFRIHGVRVEVKKNVERDLLIQIVTGNPVTICTIDEIDDEIDIKETWVGYSVCKHGDKWDLKTAVTMAFQNALACEGISDVDRKEAGKEFGKVVEKIEQRKVFRLQYGTGFRSGKQLILDEWKRINFDLSKTCRGVADHAEGYDHWMDALRYDMMCWVKKPKGSK